MTFKKIIIGREIEQGPFDCDSCDRSFSTKSALAIHKTNIHIRREGQFSSNVTMSNWFFYFPFSGIVPAPKPYQCDICNKCFTRKEALIKHRKTFYGLLHYYLWYHDNNCFDCHWNANWLLWISAVQSRENGNLNAKSVIECSCTSIILEITSHECITRKRTNAVQLL